MKHFKSYNLRRVVISTIYITFQTFNIWLTFRNTDNVEKAFNICVNITMK